MLLIFFKYCHHHHNMREGSRAWTHYEHQSNNVTSLPYHLIITKSKQFLIVTVAISWEGRGKEKELWRNGHKCDMFIYSTIHPLSSFSPFFFFLISWREREIDWTLSPRADSGICYDVIYRNENKIVSGFMAIYRIEYFLVYMWLNNKYIIYLWHPFSLYQQYIRIGFEMSVHGRKFNKSNEYT